MNHKKEKANSKASYISRMLFSGIGFLFIIVFTIRGIYQIVLTLLNHSKKLGDLLSGETEHWTDIVNSLKDAPTIFNVSLMILGYLMIFHGIIGMYYFFKTDLNLKKMFTDNRWINFQIKSALGGGFLIAALYMPEQKASTHSIVYLIIFTIISIIGAFHLARGFFNASITLGISVSERTKSIVKILSWFIAIITTLQLLIFFI